MLSTTLPAPARKALGCDTLCCSVLTNTKDCPGRSVSPAPVPAGTLLGDQTRARSAVQLLINHPAGAISVTPQPGVLSEQRSLLPDPSPPAAGTRQPCLRTGVSRRCSCSSSSGLRPRVRVKKYTLSWLLRRKMHSPAMKGIAAQQTIQNETHYGKERKKISNVYTASK